MNIALISTYVFANASPFIAAKTKLLFVRTNLLFIVLKHRNYAPARLEGKPETSHVYTSSITLSCLRAVCQNLWYS